MATHLPRFGFGQVVWFINRDFKPERLVISKIELTDRNGQEYISYTGTDSTYKREDLIFATREEAIEATCKLIKGS